MSINRLILVLHGAGPESNEFRGKKYKGMHRLPITLECVALSTNGAIPPPPLAGLLTMIERQ